MITTIGIDPGNDTGWARLLDGALIICGLGAPYGHIAPGADVWIECPQIYPHGSKGDPNDLIKVAVMVGRYEQGALSSGADDVHLIHPHDWKGNVPKRVTAERMFKKYPDLWRMVSSVPAAKRHNVIDAVGIADYGYAQAKARTK